MPTYRHGNISAISHKLLETYGYKSSGKNNEHRIVIPYVDTLLSQVQTVLQEEEKNGYVNPVILKEIDLPIGIRSKVLIARDGSKSSTIMLPEEY